MVPGHGQVYGPGVSSCSLPPLEGDISLEMLSCWGGGPGPGRGLL